MAIERVVDLRDEADWKNALSDREWTELMHAHVYATEMSHGTTGHNQLLLIARLGAVLDHVGATKGQVDEAGLTMERPIIERYRERRPIWTTTDQAGETQTHREPVPGAARFIWDEYIGSYIAVGSEPADQFTDPALAT